MGWKSNRCIIDTRRPGIGVLPLISMPPTSRESTASQKDPSGPVSYLLPVGGGETTSRPNLPVSNRAYGQQSPVSAVRPRFDSRQPILCFRLRQTDHPQQAISVPHQLPRRTRSIAEVSRVGDAADYGPSACTTGARRRASSVLLPARILPLSATFREREKGMWTGCSAGDPRGRRL